MNISKVNIDTLKPAGYNPRKSLTPNDPEYIKLKKSIQEFGYVEPIIINDRTGLIIGGHQRLTVLKDLGYTDIDVVHVDLDEAHEKALNIALNKISGDWDADKLEDLLRDIDLNYDLDVEFTGFSLDEINTLFSGALDDIDVDTSNKNNTSNKDDTDDEDDVDDTDDEDIQECIKVSRLQKRYGLPYQGNKSRIADIIINILPEGERLVDLFGGGGAITHCGILYNKWSKYLYNDISTLITQFFIDAVHGKYKDERRIITREDFYKLKDTDPYVKYVWSFGNNGIDYLWGKDIEDIKLIQCHLVLDNTVEERHLALHKFIRAINNKYGSLDRIQAVERTMALANLESLNRTVKVNSLSTLSIDDKLEVSNIDYKDYKYEEGDIVYCDVPYESIRNSNKNRENYGVKFNSLEFYKWVHSQPYQVFFSSYEISDNTFYKVKIAEVQRLFGNKSDKDTEYLYSNRPIRIGDTDGEP